VVVRQRGSLTLPLWRVAGRSDVLLTEQSPRPPRGRALLFRELDGSSPAGLFSGRWLVEEPVGEGVAEAGEDGDAAAGVALPFCDLTYEAELLPRPGRSELPPATARRLLAEAAEQCVRAVAERAEALARSSAGPSWLEAPSFPSQGSAAAFSDNNADGFGPRELWGAAALPRRSWAPPLFLGVESVSLPPLAPPPLPVAAAPPPVPSEPPPRGALQEVHLRRLDRGEALHRRCIASVAIAAPLEFAWTALTEWEQHASFMPGVAVAQMLPGEGEAAAPASADTRARIRYLVAHCAPYVALHGVVTLDVLAQRAGGGGAGAGGVPPGARALHFRMLSPDAAPGAREASVRGKWLLSPDLGPEEEEEAAEAAGLRLRSGGGAPLAAEAEEAEVQAATAGRSMLKLVVEARGLLGPGMAGSPTWAACERRGDAPLSERTVYEHLPQLLGAVRLRAEALWAASQEVPGAGGAWEAALRESALRAAASRFSIAPLQLYGAEALVGRPAALLSALQSLGLAADGVMPTREQLRRCGSPAAAAIEAAVGGCGGFAAAAQLLGLRMTRRAKKPAGYWDRLENVAAEIRAFIQSEGLEPTVMPSRQAMGAAGRHDLAKLAERWGGAASLAAELGLRPARGSRRAGEAVGEPAGPWGEGESERGGDDEGPATSLWLSGWRR